MEFNDNILFVKDLLKKMQISSHIFEDKIPTEIDGGLRNMLFNTNDYTNLLLNSPSEAKSNTIYRFFDEYRCNYMFLKLPNNKSFFFVGIIDIFPPCIDA